MFIKWDRFSRNAGDAYQMISTLRKKGCMDKWQPFLNSVKAVN